MGAGVHAAMRGRAAAGWKFLYRNGYATDAGGFRPGHNEWIAIFKAWCWFGFVTGWYSGMAGVQP